MALTMCTLLSSQGPDALPAQLEMSFAREAFVSTPLRRRPESNLRVIGCLSGTPSGLHLQVCDPVTVSAVPFSASAATSDYFTHGPGPAPSGPTSRACRAVLPRKYADPAPQRGRRSCPRAQSRATPVGSGSAEGAGRTGAWPLHDPRPTGPDPGNDGSPTPQRVSGLQAGCAQPARAGRTPGTTVSRPRPTDRRRRRSPCHGCPAASSGCRRR